jgi:hypothetical protein
MIQIDAMIAGVLDFLQPFVFQTFLFKGPKQITTFELWITKINL